MRVIIGVFYMFSLLFVRVINVIIVIIIVINICIVIVRVFSINLQKIIVFSSKIWLQQLEGVVPVGVIVVLLERRTQL